jgi:allantoin racemase
MEGSMPRVCVLVPFAFDEKGLANRRAQQQSVRLGPDMVLDFKPVKAGPALYDSYHDYVLADFAMLEAGLEAVEEGYEALCIDTMSDSGVNALRSVLDIPVIGPGKASYLTALMLGNRFSVLTQWDGWIPLYRKGVQEYGLVDHLVSIRSINVMPDVENLLGGKEDVVFPKLRDAGLACVEDGADVICLGSTTMHQAHGFLRENLPVPVINPGPLSYKLAEAVLALGLTHSRHAYRRPDVEKREMIHAMARAAAESEKALA